jgi:predicted permease
MGLVSFLHRIVARPRSWVRSIALRARVEAEMSAELADHAARLAADLVRRGYGPDDAARRAAVAMGGPRTHKEGIRAALGLRRWDELCADLRYGMRMLRKSPGFTIIATLSLALAIGANATIFSVAKQLLYERLNVPHAADLRLLTWTTTKDHGAIHHIHGDLDALPGGLQSSSVFSFPAYQQLRAQTAVLGDLFAFKQTYMNATIHLQAMRVRVEMVSGNYYSALGVQPQLGRLIESSDDHTGQGSVVVISDGLWERQFNRSASVLGETIRVNGVPLTIIGVSPRGFSGLKDVQYAPDLFVPLTMQPLVQPRSDGGSWLNSPTQWWVNIMGRMQPGTTETAAQAALDGQLGAIVRSTMPVRAGDDLPRIRVKDGSRGLFEQGQYYEKPMAVLMTMVIFVLLLACANVANLMLARGSQRQREMSVRLALGAGRARILRQLLVESLLLAGLGGAGGLVMGFFGRNVIPKMTATAWDGNQFNVPFDWRVFAFTAAVTLATGILFGLAPALAAARSEVTHGLKETAQTTTRRRKGVGGKALVGLQIALSTLLVIGAGLFLRTLAGLNEVDVGFRTDHLVLAEVDLRENHYPAGQDIALHQRLERALAAVPGVDAVSPAMNSYLSEDMSAIDFLPEGESYDKSRPQEEDYNIVGTRFFETLGIPIVAGRAFADQDTATSVKVGIVNESLARKRFPGENPIGKRFAIDARDSDGHGGTLETAWIQIVGVCRDTRYMNLREPPPPQFFVPYVQQTEVGGMDYEIHTRVEPGSIFPQLRRVVQQIDPDLPLAYVRTQDEQIEADLQQERLFVTLTSGFGVLALVLACVGIYGIMAYSVANRRNEIGIRMALGAQAGQVRGMILRESSWLAGAGVVAGVALALMMTRLVKSMLYGIEPYDPATLVGSVLVLMVVALAASWIPARRAAGVQPMEALRHE